MSGATATAASTCSRTWPRRLCRRSARSAHLHPLPSAGEGRVRESLAGREAYSILVAVAIDGGATGSSRARARSRDAALGGGGDLRGGAVEVDGARRAADRGDRALSVIAHERDGVGELARDGDQRGGDPLLAEHHHRGRLLVRLATLDGGDQAIGVEAAVQT